MVTDCTRILVHYGHSTDYNKTLKILAKGFFIFILAFWCNVNFDALIKLWNFGVGSLDVTSGSRPKKFNMYIM